MGFFAMVVSIKFISENLIADVARGWVLRQVLDLNVCNHIVPSLRLIATPITHV